MRRFRYKCGIRLALISISIIALGTGISACGDNPGEGENTFTQAVPFVREGGFFGINTGTSDLYQFDQSRHRLGGSLGEEFTVETRVKVMETSAGAASAGIGFLLNEQQGYNFEIYPNEDRWKLYDPDDNLYLDSIYQEQSFELNRWYTLKVQLTGGRIHLFIDGERKSPLEGYASDGSRGAMQLRIRNSTAMFDDVSAEEGETLLFRDDFESAPADWNPGHGEAWSWEQEGEGNHAYRGNVLLGSEMLYSPELSPKLQTHFDQIEAAGARYVRAFFAWNDMQPQGPDHYFWDYTDALAVAAHDRGLVLVPAIVYVPAWALAPQDRAAFDAFSYPPRDNSEFSRFVAAVVKRYGPGGDLATQQGWGDYGAIEFEIGNEFNVPTIVNANNQHLFSGWMGDLEQYVDMLKAGHDAVKSVCGDCQVLNGAPADDVRPHYAVSRHDPGGRQYLWQAVEDLYETIQRRHPGDADAADGYFDILNIHTYQFFMFSTGGRWPDNYRDYVFPDPQWYRDRLENVAGVAGRYGDSDKRIWLTETSYSSDGAGGDEFSGFLSEAQQAEAVKMVYTEASRVAQVDKVFWWYLSDTNTRVGLVRNNLSLKPSYYAYQQLTGRDR